MGSITLLGCGKMSSSALPGPPNTLTFKQASFGPSYSDPTYTWTGVDIGNPAWIATRRVIAVIMTQNQYQPLTGVTVNGVFSLTIHGSAWANSTGSDPGVAIASGLVTSGTSSVNVTATYGGTAFTSPVVVIYIVDDSQLVSGTPSIGSNTSVPSVLTLTGSFTEAVGGFDIAASQLETVGITSHTISTSGYTDDAGGGTSRFLVSSKASLASSGSATATSSWGTTSSAAAILAASWR